MFEKSAAARPKTEVSVTMSLHGDELFDGKVFLKNDERLIDLLNDPRAFIPVRREDGATVIVAKANIVSIVEKAPPDQETKEPPEKEKRRPSFDPYKVLRLSPDASIEDVRKAYKARIKAVHPDTLSGLELDDEIAKAAVLAAQKVNYAYQRILRDRQNATDADAPEKETAKAS
jgi:hypothetical protein